MIFYPCIRATCNRLSRYTVYHLRRRTLNFRIITSTRKSSSIENGNKCSPVSSQTLHLKQAINSREMMILSLPEMRPLKIAWQSPKDCLRRSPPWAIPKGPLGGSLAAPPNHLRPPRVTRKWQFCHGIAAQRGSRECISEYPLGVTNYNFGGSCEATAVDALVHANTRSIPFPFPGSSSHTPLPPHSFHNLPSLF